MNSRKLGAPEGCILCTKRAKTRLRAYVIYKSFPVAMIRTPVINGRGSCQGRGVIEKVMGRERMGEGSTSSRRVRVDNGIFVEPCKFG